MFPFSPPPPPPLPLCHSEPVSQLAFSMLHNSVHLTWKGEREGNEREKRGRKGGRREGVGQKRERKGNGGGKRGGGKG